KHDADGRTEGAAVLEAQRFEGSEITSADFAQVVAERELHVGDGVYGRRARSLALTFKTACAIGHSLWITMGRLPRTASCPRTWWRCCSDLKAPGASSSSSPDVCWRMC